APRFAVMRPTLDTFIGVKPSTSIIVMAGEPTAAASTHDQAGEVRWSAPCCPHGIGASAVGLQPALVALIVLGGNVGRTAVGQQNEPVVRGHHHPPSAWSLRLFAARIFLSPSVDVEACIEGMFEHGL